MSTINRAVTGALFDRLTSPPPLLQVVTGPRQVGKTTAARQVAERWPGPSRYAAADLPFPPGPEWIEGHWQAARRETKEGKPALLVLDEVHKVRGWSEVVKALWDQDRAAGTPVQVVLLGSSSLLLAKGTTDSLAGRFFLHRCLHWSFPECRQAFGWDLPRWLFFGGYPGAAPLADDTVVWRTFVVDSLVETVLARDVMALQTIGKPALLRHLFGLAASYHAQIVSFTKMLGQLQDAGNTTTLAHYLTLLETAYLISGLPRFSGTRVRSRGSSPKLILWNNALASSLALLEYPAVLEDRAVWGRLVENAVGAHLLNHLQALPYKISYWREGNLEVDFVVRTPKALWAIEVKSGRPTKPEGLEKFCREHRRVRPLLIGSGGMPLEEFFSSHPAELFSA